MLSPENNFQQFKNQGYEDCMNLTLSQLKKQSVNLFYKLQIEIQTNKLLLERHLGYVYLIKHYGGCYFYLPTCAIPRQPQIQAENYKQAMENQNALEEEKKILKYSAKTSIDTKNIPKNFGTAISVYIKNNIIQVKKLLRQKRVSLTEFISFSKQAKLKINSLVDLRNLWSPNNQGQKQTLKDCYRIISYQFIKKHSLKYIYSSRIKNTKSHVRYRMKILQGMEDPCNFNNLKDY